MRTTIDIPDETYRALKIKAATEGTSLRQIILVSVERELVASKGVRKFEIPIPVTSSPVEVPAETTVKAEWSCPHCGCGGRVLRGGKPVCAQCLKPV
jgi:hypothetical protein